MIRMIQKPRLKDLLVQARAIESHCHGQLDVGLKRLVRRRGVYAVGIEALIQHQTLEDRLIIDHELHPVKPHAAKAEVALQAIHLLSVLFEDQTKVVKLRLANVPQMLLDQGDRRLRRAAVTLCAHAAHRRALVGSRRLKRAGGALVTTRTSSVPSLARGVR